MNNNLLAEIIKVSYYIDSHYGEVQPIIMMGKTIEEHNDNYDKMLNLLIKIIAEI